MIFRATAIDDRVFLDSWLIVWTAVIADRVFLDSWLIVLTAVIADRLFLDSWFIVRAALIADGISLDSWEVVIDRYLDILSWNVIICCFCLSLEVGTLA